MDKEFEGSLEYIKRLPENSRSNSNDTNNNP